MIEDAFVQYLLQDTGFRRVTDLRICQYQKLQHFGGIICTRDSEDDKYETVGGLSGKDYWGVHDISISYSVWEKAAEDSRFARNGFFRVFGIYKGESMLASEEQEEIRAQKEQQDVQSLFKRYACVKAGEWLNWMQGTNHKSYGNIRQLLNSNKWQTVCFILDVIN